jgi:hypothetical protein
MQIVIPSRERSDILADCSLKIFPDAMVCVAESEVEAYKPLTQNLLVHPDSVVGLPVKRQWILDQLDDEVVVQVDDDLVFVRSLASCRSSVIIRRPEDVYRIVENAMMCAKGSGAGVFGFATTGDMRMFRPYKPFRLAGWCGSVLGVIGRKVRYDPNVLIRDDVDLCLQSMLKHRIIWQDSRFFFENKYQNFTGPGGNAKFRSEKQQSRDVETLKRKWAGYFSFRKALKSEMGGEMKMSLNIRRTSGRIL